MLPRCRGYVTFMFVLRSSSVHQEVAYATVSVLSKERFSQCQDVLRGSIPPPIKLWQEVRGSVGVRGMLVIWSEAQKKRGMGEKKAVTPAFIFTSCFYMSCHPFCEDSIQERFNSLGWAREICLPRQSFPTLQRQRQKCDLHARLFDHHHVA